MQRLEVSCAVRSIYGSLGAKGLREDCATCIMIQPGQANKDNSYPCQTQTPHSSHHHSTLYILRWAGTT
jgi:hypothetical protein